MIDDLSMEMEDQQGRLAWETGVTLFDEHSVYQRIAMLNEVCRALLVPSLDMPELTAELEATVMAIFSNIKTLVEIEIDCAHCFDEPSCDDRLRVLSVMRDVYEEGGEDWDDFPDPWCDDLERWELEIESLADRILWDRDFEMAGMIVDEDPETAESYKQVLGIENDYFSMAPPDIDEEDAIACLHSLRSFLDGSAKPRKPR